MAKYIDADELIKTLNREGVPFNEDVNYFILHAPAADVAEVKHGRWKPFDLTWGRSVYTCTACGEAFEVPTEWGEPMYKYCPMCGASMDEVEE